MGEHIKQQFRRIGFGEGDAVALDEMDEMEKQEKRTHSIFLKIPQFDVDCAKHVSDEMFKTLFGDSREYVRNNWHFNKEDYCYYNPEHPDFRRRITARQMLQKMGLDEIEYPEEAEKLDEPELTESEARKRTPIYSGVLQYFPDAIAGLARQSWKGNNKHNPGEPLGWSREKSSDHMDCIARHLMTPDEIDPETGETHLVAVAWRALAALQIQQEKLKGIDAEGKNN